MGEGESAARAEQSAAEQRRGGQGIGEGIAAQGRVRLDQDLVRYFDFDARLFLIGVALIDHVLILMHMVTTFPSFSRT